MVLEIEETGKNRRDRECILRVDETVISAQIMPLIELSLQFKPLIKLLLFLYKQQISTKSQKCASNKSYMHHLVLTLCDRYCQLLTFFTHITYKIAQI